MGTNSAEKNTNIGESTLLARMPTPLQTLKRMPAMFNYGSVRHMRCHYNETDKSEIDEHLMSLTRHLTEEWIRSSVVSHNLCPYANTGKLDVRVSRQTDMKSKALKIFLEAHDNTTSSITLAQWKRFYREKCPWIFDKAV